MKKLVNIVIDYPRYEEPDRKSLDAIVLSNFEM